MKAPSLLRLTGDLLNKMRHDLEVLRNDPANAYAAYNFFATGVHMLDWVYAGAPAQGLREEVLADSPLLQVCAQIAGGVAQLVPERPASEPSLSWAIPSAFRRPARAELWIHLQGDAAQRLGRKISAVALAGQVHDFWAHYSKLEQTTVVKKGAASPAKVASV